MYEFHSTSSPTQGAPSPSALQSAIAFLRRGLRPDGTYEGTDEWEVSGHQWRLLHEWARVEGLILPVSLSPAMAGGSEHDVRHDSGTGRWLKFTKPNRSGYAVKLLDAKLTLLPATPLQYLQRWRVAARIFSDDVELIGLSVVGAELKIVVSQRDLIGEAPTWEELHFAMTELYQLQQLRAQTSLGGL